MWRKYHKTLYYTTKSQVHDILFYIYNIFKSIRYIPFISTVLLMGADMRPLVNKVLFCFLFFYIIISSLLLQFFWNCFNNNWITQVICYINNIVNSWIIENSIKHNKISKIYWKIRKSVILLKMIFNNKKTPKCKKTKRK